MEMKKATPSTGPRTQKGKERSSKNSRKHGILSGDYIVPGETEKEFSEFAESIADELKPETARQELVVNHIVLCHWRLRRCLRAESDSWLQHFELSSIEKLMSESDKRSLGEASEMAIETNLKIYQRYEVFLTRQIRKLSEDLRKLKSESG